MASLGLGPHGSRSESCRSCSCNNTNNNNNNNNDDRNQVSGKNSLPSPSSSPSRQYWRSWRWHPHSAGLSQARLKGPQIKGATWRVPPGTVVDWNRSTPAIIDHSSPQRQPTGGRQPVQTIHRRRWAGIESLSLRKLSCCSRSDLFPFLLLLLLSSSSVQDFGRPVDGEGRKYCGVRLVCG